MDKSKISIVVPCYNEEEALPLFYAEICRVANEMNSVLWEFNFIDDGSKDRTIDVLRNLSSQDSRVHFVSFSRNFGKEAAMLAGLRMATGDFAAVLDADLQHPPAMLLQMYEAVKDGQYDCAAARRISRTGELPLRSFLAQRFYKIINKLADAEFVEGATDFRLMRRTVVDAILSLTEYNRFTKGIFSWVGFRTKWIPYENKSRVAGETKWSLWTLLRYSLEGIISFSTTPLLFSSMLGMLVCFVAFFMLIFILVKTLIFGDPVAGFPTLISVILLIGGLQMLFIGILGQYLAKTYLETKHRPIYIIQETEEGMK